MNNNEFILTITDEKQLMDHAELIYHLVWRVDFTAPGFAIIDIPPGPDSHITRSWMVLLKQRLSEIAVIQGLHGFTYMSMSRFDQQVTTKFHLDGAPEQSMLMLGYEPSQVHSRLFLADYSRAAFDLGITPNQFLKDFNPMYKKGEERLREYVTELPQSVDGYSRILLINNSSLPFIEFGTNSLGVMHKAIIVTPDESKTRIVNSTMLALGNNDEISHDLQHEFATTDEISKRTY